MPTNYIQVPVPEEHVPEVIALLADLNRGVERPSEQADPGDRLDAPLVVTMYVDSERRHRQLLDLLASRAGEWLYTSELADALSVSSGSKGMAGVFGAFGRRAKHRYGGAKPWETEWDPIQGEAKYRMSPQVAAWLDARD